MKKGRMTIANDKRWRAESDEECSIQADTKGLVQPFMFFFTQEANMACHKNLERRAQFMQGNGIPPCHGFNFMTMGCLLYLYYPLLKFDELL